MLSLLAVLGVCEFYDHALYLFQIKSSLMYTEDFCLIEVRTIIVAVQQP